MAKEIDKYINMILGLVRTKDDLDQILFDISVLGDRMNYDTIAQQGEALADKKKALLKSKIDIVTSLELKRYLMELIEKDDFWLFEPAHYKVFQKELNDSANRIVFFKLITAVELKPEDLREMTERLRQKLEKVVVIDVNIDESLVGGAIIKRDNYILDFSLKSKLNRLGAEWRKAIERAEGIHA